MAAKVLDNSPQAAAGSVGLLDRPAVQYVLVVLLASVVVLFRLGAATLEEHEARASLSAKAMYKPSGWLVQPPIALGDDSDDPAAAAKLDQPLPQQTAANRWLIPINNGRPRLEKTPLAYWTTAGLALLAGTFNEFVARLSSALSAVLLVVITLALGRRMLPPRAAFLGAVMLACTLGLQKWGRSARPDMLLCLLCTASMAAFYIGLNATTRTRRVLWMLGFWVLMGLANLAKQFYPMLLGLPLMAYLAWRQGDADESQGKDIDSDLIRDRLGLDRNLTAGSAATSMPSDRSRRRLAIYCISAVALMVLASLLLTRLPGLLPKRLPAEKINTLLMLLSIAVPLVVYGIVTRGYRQLVRLLPTAVPGVLIMAAMFLPWIWYMMKLFPNAAEIFDQQVGERAAGTDSWSSSGGADPSYYIMPLLTLSLPWLLFVPGGFAVAWMKRFAQHRRGLVYLMLWSVLLLGLLTLSAGKREHYLMPMLPALCLLMGFAANDVLFNHQWVSVRRAKGLLIGYAAFGLLSPALMLVPALVFPDAAPWRHMAIVCGVAAALCGVMLVMVLRGRLATGFALLAVAITVVYTGYAGGVEMWDKRTDVASFAREARRRIPASATVVAWGEPQMKTVYYFGRTIPDASYQLHKFRRQKDAAGDEAFNAWLADPANAQYIFTYGTLEPPQYADPKLDKKKAERLRKIDDRKKAERKRMTDLGFWSFLSMPTLHDRNLRFSRGKFTVQDEVLPFVLLANPSIKQPATAP